MFKMVPTKKTSHHNNKKLIHLHESLENTGYSNGLPNWGTYLGIPKNKSIKIIDNAVEVIYN